MLKLISAILGTIVIPILFALAANYAPSPSLLEIIIGLMAIGSLIGGGFITYTEYIRYKNKAR